MKRIPVSLLATILVATLIFVACENPAATPPPDTSAADVAAAKSALAVGYTSGETAAGVKSNLTLPTSVAGADGVAVSWASSDATVVSAAGAVTRPAIGEQYKVVNLTATLAKGSARDTKAFQVIVRCQSVALSKTQLDEAIVWPNFGADQWGNAIGQVKDKANSSADEAYIDTTGNGGLAYSFRMKYESAANNGDFIFLFQRKFNDGTTTDITSNYWNAANQTHGIAFTQSWESPQGAGKGRVVGMGYGKNPLNGIWGDSATNAWTDGAFHDVTIVKSARNASNEVVFTVYLDGVQYWQQTETGVPDYSGAARSYILGYNVYNATVTFADPTNY